MYQRAHVRLYMSLSVSLSMFMGVGVHVSTSASHATLISAFLGLYPTHHGGGCIFGQKRQLAPGCALYMGRPLPDPCSAPREPRVPSLGAAPADAPEGPPISKGALVPAWPPHGT